MLTREEVDGWLRLQATPGLGRAAARQLLASFGAADAIAAAPRAALAAVVGGALAERLCSPGDEHAALLQRTIDWLATDATRDLVTLGDERYPPWLLNTADPPLALHVQGRIEVLAQPALAIVGSRHATPQGLDHARRFAARLSQEGLVIVSGLALGIDAAAHEGALETGAPTIAVVGTGLDRVYPARHRALAHRICAQGLMLGELPLGAPPLPPHFPSRNRIIAGLSQGTLVVEAALQSGSLVTARLAAEAGREVFAIPGSIHSPVARGCHALIKQGAKLVESAEDVLVELRRLTPLPGVGAGAFEATGDDETIADDAVDAGDADAGHDGGGDCDALLRAMGHDPVTPDALQARTGLPTSELGARLLALELDGRVSRLPGGLFQRRRRA